MNTTNTTENTLPQTSPVAELIRLAALALPTAPPDIADELTAAIRVFDRATCPVTWAVEDIDDDIIPEDDEEARLCALTSLTENYSITDSEWMQLEYHAEGALR